MGYKEVSREVRKVSMLVVPARFPSLVKLSD